MKFLVTKDLNYSRFYAYLVGSVVSVILVYLIFDTILHVYVIGADIAGIKTTLYGDAETFAEPILIDSLLLQVHIDLFMTLFALLILSSVYIRLSTQCSVVKAIVHLLFLLGIMTPLFLLAAYFGLEIFVYLWLVAFLAWHGIGVILSLVILKQLVFR